MTDRLVHTLYGKCDLKISNKIEESEGSAYNAARFQLNDFSILSRTAKQTPKKVGQFVTCWKRNETGETTPISHTDAIDFYVITVKKLTNNQVGQFVFPKALLIQKGIISTNKKVGKRGFRVYPPWDTVTSKQAITTQQWQQTYFYTISNDTDPDVVKRLFQIE